MPALSGPMVNQAMQQPRDVPQIEMSIAQLRQPLDGLHNLSMRLSTMVQRLRSTPEEVEKGEANPSPSGHLSALEVAAADYEAATARIRKYVAQLEKMI